MEITITLREAGRKETLCLDERLRMDEVLRRLRAQGVYSAGVADCRFLRSLLRAELVDIRQSFREAGIVSGDDLELV